MISVYTDNATNMKNEQRPDQRIKLKMQPIIGLNCSILGHLGYQGLLSKVPGAITPV